MKIFLAVVFLCGAVSFLSAAPLEIVSGNKSSYVICVAKEALPGVKAAAQELQSLIFQATGAKLPIVDTPKKGHSIILRTDKTLPPEGFRLRTENGDLYITGHDGPGDPRKFAHVDKTLAGTWFGVNRFAEKFLDFRHFFPGKLGIHLPRRKDLTVPELDESSAPVMVHRIFTIWYHLRDKKYRAEMDLWKRRNNLGQSIGWYNNHMWRYILPPEKYLAAHPDWFAMINGRRSRESYGADEGLKICTSNMEALREFARVTVEKARKDKSPVVSVTPNDGIRFCECPQCTKDDTKGPGGEVIMSERMFRYANILADMIHRQLPDVKIAMLAYSFYRTPPQKITKFHPALRIMYVCNGADTAYHDPAFRARMRGEMKRWRELVPSLYFYNDAGKPLELPLTNPENIGKLFADLAETGVTGYALEHFASFWSSPLNHYLFARMLWDPGADFEALYADALQKCYGPAAAEAVRAYNADVSAGRKRYVEFVKGKTIDYRRRLHAALDVMWNGLYEKHYAFLAAKLAQTPDPGQKARLQMVLDNLRYVKMTLDLHNLTKKVLGKTAPSAAEAAQVIRLAGERKKFLREISRRNPDVACDRLDRQEKWYMLPFDPAYLKTQLVHKKRPYVLLAQQGKYPARVVIGKEMATGAPVKVRGLCIFLPDEKGLTLRCRVEEPFMDKLDDALTAPDSAVWNENCVDIFFDPGCTGKELIHLIANSRGTLFASKAGVKKWRHGIEVKATKEKAAWQLEFFIPWRDLGGRPPRGTIWGFNAGRVRHTVTPNEYSCWTPTFSGFGAPEFFGRLIF